MAEDALPQSTAGRQYVMPSPETLEALGVTESISSLLPGQRVDLQLPPAQEMHIDTIEVEIEPLDGHMLKGPKTVFNRARSYSKSNIYH